MPGGDSCPIYALNVSGDGLLRFERVQPAHSGDQLAQNGIVALHGAVQTASRFGSDASVQFVFGSFSAAGIR
jgi:hypothetical protein